MPGCKANVTGTGQQPERRQCQVLDVCQIVHHESIRWSVFLGYCRQLSDKSHTEKVVTVLLSPESIFSFSTVVSCVRVTSDISLKERKILCHGQVTECYSFHVQGMKRKWQWNLRPKNYEEMGLKINFKGWESFK